jgi:hypothetical protein
VDEEVRSVEELHRAEERAGYRDVLKPNLRPAFIIGVGTALFNQPVGVNAVVYYAPTLLSDERDSVTPPPSWPPGASGPSTSS